MKTSIRLIIVMIACLALFSACPGEGRHNAATFFTYKNEISDNYIRIIVTSVRKGTNVKIVNSYRLEANEQIRMSYYPENYQYPFCLFSDDPTNCDNTVEIQGRFSGKIIQTYPDGSLFDINNYKLIKRDNERTDYEFTLTDDLFKDAIKK